MSRGRPSPGLLMSAAIAFGVAPVRAAEPDVAAAVAEAERVAAAGPFQPTWASLERYHVPDWYRDAKFGVFIHWGPYSVPAHKTEWYARRMYDRNDPIYAYHREKYGPQDKFGYKDFIPQFKAEKFDPAAWAKLFREAGARYVVPVAEHHDGFPMYDCSFTDWSAAKMGPKRDVIAELGTAVRSEGLRFGVSSHRGFLWAYYARDAGFDTVDPKYFGLYGQPQPFLAGGKLPKQWPAQDKAFMDDWLARTCELVDKYRPELVWFDFDIAPNWVPTPDANPVGSHLRTFAAYYYNRAAGRNQSAVINYKHQAYPEAAAVFDIERGKMDRIRTPAWQTDTSITTTGWSHDPAQEYKPAGRIVDDLVDIVAKNGCLLLNVGPRADGTIPEPSAAVLRDIGKWLSVNGEAVYGTRPWRTFGEGPTATVAGHHAEKKNKPFTAEDVRFTTKGDALYAIALDWPAGGALTIKSLKAGAEALPGEITAVTLLGSDAPLKWVRDDAGLTITLPAAKPCDYAYAFKLTTAGKEARR